MKAIPQSAADSSAEVQTLSDRVSELDEAIHQRVRSIDGLLSFACIAGLCVLFVIVLVAYFVGETGLAMLFAAIGIMCAPFAIVFMGKAVRPLWRMVNERAQLRVDRERLRAEQDGYRVRAEQQSAPPVTQPAAEHRVQSGGLDPFTAPDRQRRARLDLAVAARATESEESSPAPAEPVSPLPDLAQVGRALIFVAVAIVGIVLLLALGFAVGGSQ